MTTVRLVLTVALLSLIIVGCSTERTLDCRTGTEGFDVSFSNTYFPERIRPGVETPIIVDIANRGATTDTARIRLSYNRDFFSSDRPLAETLTVVGKERSNRCTGMNERTQFTIKAYELPVAVSSFERPLIIDLCYHYGTNVTTQVCIEPVPDELSAVEPNCKASDVTLSGGQGAPLSVTQVDAPVYFENVSGSYVRFPIRLVNHGDGTIIAHSTENDFDAACSFSDEGIFENYVYVKALLDGSDEGIRCDGLGTPDREPPTGKVYLRYDPDRIERDDGVFETVKNHYFECVAEVDSFSDARTAVLDLEIYYYYREFRADEQTTEVQRI